MIGTNIKANYMEAIKDIRAIMLGPCPVNIVGVLACEQVPTLLRRWVLSRGDEIYSDIRTDFQAILAGLDKIIEVFPDEPWLRIMRGRALMAVGWQGRAIDDFHRAMNAVRDSADLYLFVAEAYFGLAGSTLGDAAGYYGFAAYNATKSIQLHTVHQNSPRPYMIRAQSDAHILKISGYHRKTEMFYKKYRDIEADLRASRDVSDEAGKAVVARIAENVKALLGVEEE